MFTKYNPSYFQTIEERLKELTDFLVTSSRKYLEIIGTGYDFNYGSLLDKERIKTCLRVMVSGIALG